MLDACRAFVATHELSRDPEDFRRWVGKAEGVPVTLTVQPASPTEACVRVAFEIGCPGLTVAHRNLDLATGGGVATGDKAFDETVVVMAEDARAAYGLLDRSTRDRLRALVLDGAFIADGRLVIVMRPGEGRGAELLSRMLVVARHCLETTPERARARALELDAAVGDAASLERLASGLDDADESAKERYRRLVKLTDVFPIARWSTTVGALLDSTHSRALGYRALLRYLRHEGADLGAALDLMLDNASRTQRLALDIVKDLGNVLAGFDDPRAAKILGALCDDDDPAARTVALEAFCQSPVAASTKFAALSERAVWRSLPIIGTLPTAIVKQHDLLELFFRSQASHEVPVLLTFFSAFSHSGDARWTPYLIDGLAHADNDVRIAALDGLGQVGDASALRAVRELTTGFFRSERVKDSAKLAFAKISQRVGERAGALALADDRGGGLSDPQA